jgi:hypothetical protein
MFLHYALQITSQNKSIRFEASDIHSVALILLTHVLCDRSKHFSNVYRLIRVIICCRYQRFITIFYVSNSLKSIPVSHFTKIHRYIIDLEIEYSDQRFFFILFFSPVFRLSRKYPVSKFCNTSNKSSSDPVLHNLCRPEVQRLPLQTT